MRTILPDEKTQTTNIEMMTTCKSVLRIAFLCVFVVVMALICFVPPNTRHKTTKTHSLTDAVSKVTNIGRFSNFNPLSSFMILSVKPYLTKAVKNELINISGVARLYDSSMNMVSDRNISVSKKITCKTVGGCPPIIAMAYDFVDFSYSSLVADVSLQYTENKILKKAEFSATSLNSYISIIFFVFISAFTVVLSVTLICFVPRRLYPTRPDHWSTLYLGLAALCLDGPWLILKYYSSKWFSNIYDIMPELFHIVFIIFFMSFFNAQTHGWANRIFGSWLLSLIIAAGLILVIILENVVTNLVPLNALSVFLDDSLLKIPLYGFTFLMHAIIISMIILGVCSVQIQNDATLVLVSLSILIVEVLDVLRVCLRFWAPLENLGYSFSADVLYILVANWVTSFFLRNNLPVQLAIETEMKEEMKQEMIAETSNEQIDVDTTQL